MVYLKNRSSTKLLSKIISYKPDTSGKLDLNNLHKFGYIVYYHNKDQKYTKLSNKGIKYVFFDYKSHN